MKGHSNLSYSHYVPPLFNGGDIYICRIVPFSESIHFEWKDDLENAEYEIFFRKRGTESFASAGKTAECEFDIQKLCDGTDYEFYVQSGNKKSRIRLARTGEPIGTVVNYLHPEDGAYSFSGSYLCSPSLVRHPEGYLLASMDVYDLGAPQNLALIFRSDDDGKTWHHVSDLMPCFWPKLFIHRGDLYVLACSCEYGDLLISRSCDGGKTFCAPVALLRGSGGKKGNCGVHKNPQNVFYHGGRIYETLEWGTWENKEYGHAAMVMSCSEDDDLLVPENWSFTEPVKFDHFAPEISHLKKPVMTIEGTLTLSPCGKLLNIMRFGMRDHVLAYEVNTEHHEAPLKYHGIIKMGVTFAKFMIKFDDVSGKYYSVASKTHDGCPDYARNYLVLLCSPDLENWTVERELFDFRHIDAEKVGLQYIDFSFDGDDIIYLCRTAINDAASFHDSNYSTFHRICNFRGE
ncbi:MAG: exo-alpha-sialidase [Clostridia bacterium]|nr:exo-alpha-sialidase [Clostridia bacterium]